jgi:flagellar protein FliS
MMMPNRMGYQAYQRNKYETASPHKLILLLYEGALQFCSRAQASIRDRQLAEANAHILRVQDILCELLSCLNEEQGGEIGKQLKSLYLYMIDRLVEANVKKSAEPLDEVAGILREIKTAWEQIGKDVSIGKTTI